MSIYSAKYRLSSCKVDKELLKELEDYILREAEKYLSGSDSLKEKIDFVSMKKEMYHFSIQGKGSITKYESVEKYEGTKLPDRTSIVALEFSSIVDKFFLIKVNFHSSISEHPVLKVAISDIKAKEICKPIADGIIQIVKEHRNSNYLFHNRTVQIGFLLLYTMYCIINFFILNYTQGPYILANSMIYDYIFVCMIFWFLISIFLRKYTSFDTKRQKVINISYIVFTLMYFSIVVLLFSRLLSKLYGPF